MYLLQNRLRPVWTSFFAVFCGPGPWSLISEDFWDWIGPWSKPSCRAYVGSGLGLDLLRLKPGLIVRGKPLQQQNKFITNNCTVQVDFNFQTLEPSSNLGLIHLFVFWKCVKYVQKGCWMHGKTDGSELWNTLEGMEHGKMGWEVDRMREGKGYGTYSVGVKDLASAYVLCPRLAEGWGLSIYGRLEVTE